MAPCATSRSSKAESGCETGGLLDSVALGFHGRRMRPVTRSRWAGRLSPMIVVTNRIPVAEGHEI
ncbi:MAG: hypothetical protein RL385_310, partial [Pseudomonadota bacterium]